MKRTGFLLASAMAFVVCLAVPALASSGSSLPHNPGGPGVSGAGGASGATSVPSGKANACANSAPNAPATKWRAVWPRCAKPRKAAKT